MKHLRSHLFLILGLLPLSLGAPCAAFASSPLVVQEDTIIEFPEQEMTLSSTSVGNGEREMVDVPVISWSDMPFQTVKKQALDYSCGSAAVSTLLSYVYGQKTSEGDVFKAMFDAGDKNKIRTEGFSLLDMSQYLNKKGFKAVGYKVDLDVIEKKEAPFIALVNNDGYNHFVVVKSIKGPLVLVGDPSKGNVVYKREDFASMWNGIALVVVNHARKAREVFSSEAEWTYAHARAMPALGHSADDLLPALAPLQWQIAPATTDILSASLSAANQF